VLDVIKLKELMEILDTLFSVLHLGCLAATKGMESPACSLLIRHIEKGDIEFH